MVRFCPHVLAIGCALLALGCGDEVTETSAGSGSGGQAGALPTPPDAGPRAGACAAGELELADRSCRAAGVTPGRCAAGFVHDGDVGCEPLLPADRCPPGQMAVPGETACRDVARCGSGTWGDVPTDGTTQHVDASYSGGNSSGSATAPWTTIQAGIDAAASDAIVAIAAGSYAENLLVDAPVRLWGKCPAEVTIAHSTSGPGVYVRAGADGTEVRNLAITNGTTAVLVRDANDVLVEQVWIHDLVWMGLYVYAPTDGATASATLRGSLIEGAVANGVYALGSSVEVHDSVVRGTQPETSGDGGKGINTFFDEDRMAASSLVVTGSVVEDNHEMGIRFSAADGSVERTVVRGTQVLVSDGNLGAGIYLKADSRVNAYSSATVRDVYVADNATCGICGFDSTLEVERATVHGTRLSAQDLGAGFAFASTTNFDVLPVGSLSESALLDSQVAGIVVNGAELAIEGVHVREVSAPDVAFPNPGFGITLAVEPATPRRSAAHVRGVVVEDVHSFGIAVQGSSADMASVAVRNVAADPRTGGFGRGISCEAEPMSGERCDIALRNGSVDNVREVGVAVVGSDAVIEDVTVKNVQPRDSDDQYGMGIVVQKAFETLDDASGDISWSLVENTHWAGLYVGAGTMTVSHVITRNAQSHPQTGEFGDGLVASALVYDPDLQSYEPGTLLVTDSIVEHHARAGATSFSGDVTVTNSWFQCNDIDMDGEAIGGVPFAFEDGGGNVCGCDGSFEECVVLSSNLSAPPAF